MDSFQKGILILAIIILLLALIFIGMTLKSTKNITWPPITADCPDYWTIKGSVDGSGNDASGNSTSSGQNVCVNVKNLGTCPAQNGQKHLIMNFNTDTYTGSQGLCNKYTWANNCGVSWDGITYGINNPCSTT
jgi:hypothetical protein